MTQHRRLSSWSLAGAMLSRSLTRDTVQHSVSSEHWSRRVPTAARQSAHASIKHAHQHLSNPPPLPTNKPPKKYHHKTSQNNRITPTSPALITHRFRRSSCCSARSSRRRYRRARTRRRRSTSCTTLARTSAGCQTRSRSSPGAAGAPKLPLGAKKEKGVCGQVSGSWVSGCV